MSLTSFERQEQLLLLIQQQQRVTVTEASESFAVSEATVRRDLDALAERGQVQRFHGGALAPRTAPPEVPALQRERMQNEEKARIAVAAADLIEDGSTVFLGSGTTVFGVARQLRGRRLTVITNSLLVINELADEEHMTLIVLGGVMRSSEMSMIGHITEEALSQVNATHVVIGIHALDVRQGLTNDSLPETKTDRAILAQGAQIIVVADHTKCERISTAHVAPVSAIHTLVTDSGTSTTFTDELRSHGIEVIRV